MSVTEVITTEYLVAAAPYLIGFEPKESFVIMWFNDNDQLGLTQRSDIDDVRHPDLINAGVMNNFTKAVCISFSDKRPDELLDTHFHVGDRLEEAGVEIIDLMHYSNGRYWSYDMPSSELVRDPGSEFSEETLLAIQSRFALEGVAVMDSRDSLSTAIQPSDGNVQKYGAAKRWWNNQVSTLGVVNARYSLLDLAYTVNLSFDVDDKDCLRISAALSDLNMRDAIVCHLAQMDQEELHHTYNNLASICRVTPRSKAAPILTVTGICGYFAGNGAVGNVCCDLALEIDPSYPLAKLLSVALSSGLSPVEYRQWVNELDVSEIIGQE